MQGRKGVAVWPRSKGFVRAGIASAIAALVLAIGMTAAPEPARAGVVVTHFVVDPSNGSVSLPPEPMDVPPAVAISLEGTTGTTNPFPSIPEAVEYDHLIRSQKNVGALETPALPRSFRARAATS